MFVCKNLFWSHRFTIDSQEHLGNYSCMFGSEAKVEFVLAGTTHLCIPANICILHMVRQCVTVSDGDKVSNNFIPCRLPVPQIGEVRDKPIVSYVGDSVVIACKMEETKPKPSTWNWYRANGTEKVGELLRRAFCVALQ